MGETILCCPDDRETTPAANSLGAEPPALLEQSHQEGV